MRKGRLQWEGFAQKGGFKPGMKAISLHTHAEGSLHAKNQLDPFIRFSSTPVCQRMVDLTDRQTRIGLPRPLKKWIGLNIRKFGLLLLFRQTLHGCWLSSQQHSRST